MTSKYLYRKSDGLFLSGGFFDVRPPLIPGPNDPEGNPTQVPDFTTYGIAEFGDADQPDLRLHRFDATLGKRPATAPELAAVDDSKLIEQATITSRQRDILAMVALMVKRTATAPTWTAMTPAQKKTAVLAAADEWQSLRVLVDKFV